MPAGLVISQSPPALSQLPRGATVTVTVSIGNKIELPNLMGLPEDRAQDTIRSLGLTTTYVNYQRAQDIPKDERWRLDQVAPGERAQPDARAGHGRGPGHYRLPGSEEPVTASTTPQLNEILREAREVKGATLGQAEAATRVRQKYLKAMEEGDWASLPEPLYTRGFLRSYARYLGLDGDGHAQAL